MADFVADEMRSLGIDVRLKDLGKQPNTNLDIPPLILGRYGNDAVKPTILVYSHYDVQPAVIEDGWDYDPFDLTISDGKLCGRGTSDDKGPLLGWLNTIEAFQAADLDVPANLVFAFEGTEEIGSFGFRQGLEDEAHSFFGDIDAVCITDTTWTGNVKPSITRGLRGILFYNLGIRGAERDAHSGAFGGHFSEPMTDMVRILGSLVDSTGKILVPGIYDQVAPVLDEERESYERMEFSMEELDAGMNGRSLHENVTDILISRYVAIPPHASWCRVVIDNHTYHPVAGDYHP